MNFMVAENLFSLEEALYLEANSLAGFFLLDLLMFFFAVFLIYLLPIYVVYLLFQTSDDKKIALIICLSILLTFVFLNGISGLLIRDRPLIEHGTVSEFYGSRTERVFNNPFTLLHNIFETSYDSFPSNHMAVVVGFLIPLLYKKDINPKTLFFLILSFLIGIGRFFVGYHYPIDYIGSFFAASLAFGIIYLVDKDLDGYLDLVVDRIP